MIPGRIEVEDGLTFHVGLTGEDEYLERLGEGVQREDAQQRCGKDYSWFHECFYVEIPFPGLQLGAT